MKIYEFNENFGILEAIKLLCCLHSLFNENLNFSKRLVQIKLYTFFPTQVHRFPEIWTPGYGQLA